MTIFALTFPDFDPVALSIGPFAIKWYGLSYLAGLVIGWIYIRRLLSQPTLWRNNTPPFSVAKVDDLLLYITLGVVLGGRLGYVLLYEPATYLAAPADILAVWKGGMSFHGALAGCAFSVWLFGRRNGVSALSAMDLGTAAVPLGIFFGRIANFINGELFGRVSDVPWAMVFPHARYLHPDVEPATRHPSQLYEAATEGLLLLIVLAIVVRRQGFAHPGRIAGLFGIGYAVTRIFCEFFREPDRHLGFLAGGWLTMGMVLSVPMAVAGLWLYRRARPAPVAA